MARKRITLSVLTVLIWIGIVGGNFSLISPTVLAETPQNIPLPILLESETRQDDYFLTRLAGKEPATDSASAATALATGHKTDAGNLAWLPGDPVTGSLTTIAETLRADYGFAIGAASTVQFSHATPASFVAHNANRGNYAEIANEIVHTVRPEVVVGGGHPGFNGGNYNYVGGAATWDALNTGVTSYTHVVTRVAGVDGGAALRAAAATVDLAGGDRLIGIFGGAGNNFDVHVPADAPGSPSVARGSVENPTLADVVTATLSVLSQDPDGLFAIFEQGDVDWANHANDFASMVGGLWDLDAAVRAAEAYVAAPGGPDWTDTLLVVTSDHANSYMRNRQWLGVGDLPLQVAGGGVGTYGGNFLYPGGEVSYRTGNHTNELVTLWARGQSAYLFDDYAGSWYSGTQIVDNTQIYAVMVRAVQDAGARNVILFVGDGMHVEHEIAASRYLYGSDFDLAWHGWGELADGWAGYAATWDVTTYDVYAGLQGVAPYDSATFDPTVGYDPLRGGSAPYALQPSFAELEASPPSLYIKVDAVNTVSGTMVITGTSRTTATIVVTKTGSSNVPWTWIEDPEAGWLSTDPTSGTIAYDGSVGLDVFVDAAGLQPGFYHTDLVFSNPFGDITIPVVLKVRGLAPHRIYLPLVVR